MSIRLSPVSLSTHPPLRSIDVSKYISPKMRADDWVYTHMTDPSEERREVVAEKIAVLELQKEMLRSDCDRWKQEAMRLKQEVESLKVTSYQERMARIMETIKVYK